METVIVTELERRIAIATSTSTSTVPETATGMEISDEFHPDGRFRELRYKYS